MQAQKLTFLYLKKANGSHYRLFWVDRAVYPQSGQNVSLIFALTA